MLGLGAVWKEQKEQQEQKQQAHPRSPRREASWPDAQFAIHGMPLVVLADVAVAVAAVYVASVLTLFSNNLLHSARLPVCGVSVQCAVWDPGRALAMAVTSASPSKLSSARGSSRSQGIYL